MQSRQHVDHPVLGDEHDRRRRLGASEVADSGVVPRATRTITISRGGTVEDDAEGVARAIRGEQNGAVDARRLTQELRRELGRLDKDRLG
jgi:hypothetical protein